MHNLSSCHYDDLGHNLNSHPIDRVGIIRLFKLGLWLWNNLDYLTLGILGNELSYTGVWCLVYSQNNQIAKWNFPKRTTNQGSHSEFFHLNYACNILSQCLNRKMENLVWSWHLDAFAVDGYRWETFLLWTDQHNPLVSISILHGSLSPLLNHALHSSKLITLADWYCVATKCPKHCIYQELEASQRSLQKAARARWTADEGAQGSGRS